MHEAQNEGKTSFIIDCGLYFYTAMPFRLKNMGAMYQRLVNLMFKSQVGRNLEVYVYDLLVKSGTTKQHLSGLRGTFAILRLYQMKLNQAKCAFGVELGKFLWFMVSEVELKPILRR